MAFNSVLTPKSQRDIDRNWQYLEEQKNGLGHDFLYHVQECITSLESNPFLWQVVEDNFRRAIIRRFNHQLWYEVVDQEIIVIRVLGSSQDINL